jgi:hypothetical protein
MRKRILWATFLIVVISFGCGASNYETADTRNQPIETSGEIQILQFWQGDYPVDGLDLLQVSQRSQGIGFIDDIKTFAGVWKAFMPKEAVPEIDFKVTLVLFAHNTQFYNRISIGKVNVTNGVAELLAMETRSALPIEDKVAISMVKVTRQGITAIQSGDEIIPIKNNP